MYGGRRGHAQLCTPFVDFASRVAGFMRRRERRGCGEGGTDVFRRIRWFSAEENGQPPLLGLPPTGCCCRLTHWRFTSGLNHAQLGEIRCICRTIIWHAEDGELVKQRRVPFSCEKWDIDRFHEVYVRILALYRQLLECPAGVAAFRMYLQCCHI